MAGRLFTAETEPDQVDRPADSHEQADQGKDPLIQPLIQAVPDATPKKEPRKEVSKDGPHCILFAVGHGYSLVSVIEPPVLGRGKCRRSFI